jgi:hypothetical protein
MPRLTFGLLFQRNLKHAMNPRSRCLWFMRDNRELLPQQSIQQCRLTRIRATDDRDETGAKGHPLYYALSATARTHALQRNWRSYKRVLPSLDFKVVNLRLPSNCGGRDSPQVKFLNPL